MDEPPGPKRGLVIRSVEVGGRQLRPDTYVWILAGDRDHAQVEYRDRVGTISRDAVMDSPIARPSLQELRQLEPCFGLDDDSFAAHLVDRAHMFRINRCKEHGRYFLADMQGGVAMYERVTLLEPGEEQSPEKTWERYHEMSDDWLALAGRSRW